MIARFLAVVAIPLCEVRQVTIGIPSLARRNGRHPPGVGAEAEKAAKPPLEPRQLPVIGPLGDRRQGRPMPIEGILNLILVPVVEEVDFAVRESKDGLSLEIQLFLQYTRSGHGSPRVDLEPKLVISTVPAHVEFKLLRGQVEPSRPRLPHESILGRLAEHGEVPQQGQHVEDRSFSGPVRPEEQLLRGEMALEC